MRDQAGADARLRRLITVLVLARVLLPLALIDHTWELHRDELLYFAMGDHVAFRMQFPPFIAVLAKLGSAILGDTVWAARVPAALGGGALTALVLGLVYRLGGKASAIWIAWLALFAAPVFVRPSVLFQPVIFDQFWCALAVTGLVLAAREREPRWWILVGGALGFGLLTKASAVMYGAVALGVALAHPALRPQLRTRWPWIAAAVAPLIGLPSLLGQIHYGWPFLAQLRILEATQFQHTSPLGTLTGQGLMLAAALIVAVAGFVAAFRGGARSAAQVAALFAVGLLGTILLRGGKDYYAAPGYPVLLAVGAVALGEWLGTRGRALVMGLLVAGAVALLPMGIPVLGPATMVRYAAALGAGTTTNSGGRLDLPQDYADMLGWHAEAEAVSEVYRALTDAERAETVIGAGNYGQAGAIAFYHERYGLPYPISSAGDFHAWGAGDRSGKVLIVAANPDDLDDLQELYSQVEIVKRLRDPRRVQEEQDVAIFLCRDPKRPLREMWPAMGPEWD